MLDVQPVLDKLHELKKQFNVWHITAELILDYNGNGAVVLRDTLDNRLIAAVDFDKDDDLLEAVDRLAIKAGQTLVS